MSITVGPGWIIEPGWAFGTVPVPVGPQQEYTTPGIYYWTAPDGVTSVCVVCVGGGGAGHGTFPQTGSGGGGGLGWKNNISVTPGQSYLVVVGAGGDGNLSSTHWNGEDSYFIDTTTVMGEGGVHAEYNAGSGARAGYVGDGGGQGGAPCGNNGGDTQYLWFGGGGAGGYSGNGGDGGGGQSNPGNGTGGAYAGYLPATGSGGGGGGGYTRAGGGVGILGQGADGTAPGRTFSNGNWNYYPGTAGSGGAGQTYGGGGAGATTSVGGPGAVRIIWGSGRAFPSTNTGDL